jgi:hypothetical protein
LPDLRSGLSLFPMPLSRMAGGETGLPIALLRDRATPHFCRTCSLAIRCGLAG